MLSICNAYNNQVYSTEIIRLMNKMAIHQSKLYNLTAISCMHASLYILSIRESCEFCHFSNSFKSYVEHSIETWITRIAIKVKPCEPFGFCFEPRSPASDMSIVW